MTKEEPHLGKVNRVDGSGTERACDAAETEIVRRLRESSLKSARPRHWGNDGKHEERTFPISCIAPPAAVDFPLLGSAPPGGPHFGSSRLPKSRTPNRGFSSGERPCRA